MALKFPARRFLSLVLCMSILSCTLPARADLAIDRFGAKRNEKESPPIYTEVLPEDPEMTQEVMQKRADELEAVPADEYIKAKPDCQSFYKNKLSELEEAVSKARQSNDNFKLFQALTALGKFHYYEYNMFEKAESIAEEAVQAASKLPEDSPLAPLIISKAKECAGQNKTLQDKIEKVCQSTSDVFAIAQVFDELLEFCGKNDGDDESADRLRQQAILSAEAQAKINSAYTDALLSQADLYWAHKDSKRGLDLYKKLVETANKRFGVDSRAASKYEDELVDALFHLQTTNYPTSEEACGLLTHDPKAAEQLLLNHLKKRRKLFGSSVETAAALVLLGDYYRAIDDFRQSESYYADAVDMVYCAKGCCVEEEALALHALAGALYEEEFFAQAEECDRKGLSIRARLHPKYDRKVDSSYSFLADTLYKRPGSESRRYMKRLVSLRAEHYGIGAVETAKSLKTIADDLSDEELPFIDQVIAARKSIYGEKSEEVANVLMIYAGRLSAPKSTAKYAEAYSIYQSCKKLDGDNPAKALIESLSSPELTQRSYTRSVTLNDGASFSQTAYDAKLSEAKAAVADHLRQLDAQQATKPDKILSSVNSLSWAISSSRLDKDASAALSTLVTERTKGFVQALSEGKGDWIGVAEFATFVYLLTRQEMIDDLIKVTKVGRAKMADTYSPGSIQKLLLVARDQYKENAVYPTAACFSVDGKQLAVSSTDESIRVWNLPSKDVFKIVPAPEIHSLAFDASTGVLAGGSDNGIVELWDAKTATHISTLRPKDEGPTRSVSNSSNVPKQYGSWSSIDSLAFALDGKVLVGSGQFGVVLWTKDSDSWKEKQLLGGTTYGIAISSDGRFLSCVSEKSVSVWEIASSKKTGEFIGPNRPKCAALSGDGRYLAVSGSGLLQVWDRTTNATVLATTVAEADPRDRIVTDISFSADAKTVVAVTTKGAIHHWNLATKKLSGTKPIGKTLTQDCVTQFNIDGSKLCEASTDGVKVWSTDPTNISPSITFGTMMVAGKAERIRELVASAGSVWRGCPSFMQFDNTFKVDDLLDQLSPDLVALFKGEDASLNLTDANGKSKDSKKLHILCIGIEDGNWSTKDRVKSPIYTHDSKRILQTIETRCKSEYEVEVIPLKNEQATASAIWKAFFEIRRKAQPQDMFAFVFSGMSRRYGDKSAFLPYIEPCSARRGWPLSRCSANDYSITVANRSHGLLAFERSTANGGSDTPLDDFGFTPLTLSSNCIAERIRSIKANKQVYILNAADSESVAKAIQESPGTDAYQQTSPNRLFMTIAGFGMGPVESRDEPAIMQNTSGDKGEAEKTETSAFTEVLVDAIQGKADYSGSGAITAWELYAYVNGIGNLLAETEANSTLHSTRPERNFEICKVDVSSSSGTRDIKRLAVPRKMPEEVISRISSKNLAVFIGTDDYEDKQNWTSLANPESDAKQLADMFRDQYGWETRVYKHPSNEEFRQILDDITNLDFGDGQLFLYIAGHGCFLPKKRMGFVVARDSNVNDVRTMISHSDLQAQLSRGECHHVVLALDVCYAGTLLDPIARYMSTQVRAQRNGPDIYENAPLDTVCKQAAGHDAFKLLAPAVGPAYEGKAGRHSPFADKLLKVLKEGGGSRKPAYLRYNDLERAALDTVGEKSTGVSGDFHPNPDSMGEFIIVRKDDVSLPNAVAAPSAPKEAARNIFDDTSEAKPESDENDR